MAAALDLARLINDSNQIELQVDRMLAGIADQAFASDPDLVALKELYPGIEQVFVDTLRPIMLSEVALILPDYNRDIAVFFAGNFTRREIDELGAFWRSDAGQALLRSVSGNLDFSAMSKEVADNISGEDDFTISDGALDADKRKAAVAGVRELTPQQRVAVMRFGLTPTGRKMTELVKQKNEIDRKWANRPPSPEAEARIEREMGDALFAHIEAEESKRAATP